MKTPLWLWRLIWPVRAHLHPGAEIGGCFPDFTLTDTFGRVHSLYDDRPGMHTVLWQTNLCEDCLSKVALLEEVLRESKGGLRVLAVSILPIEDRLPGSVAARSSFPILLDPDDIVALRLGQEHPPGACPMRNVYVVDGAGTIRFKHHLSAVRPEVFRAELARLGSIRA